jgi:phytoene synthase
MGAPGLTSDQAEFEASEQHVLSIVRRAGTSFYWAMRFLPAEKRKAIFAVYAFCREVDDIADEEGAIEDKRLGLALWRDEIDCIYSGQAERPTAKLLTHYLRSFSFEKGAFLAVIDGMEMDAEGPIVAPSMAELELYCGRVAGAVGQLCIKIFGETGDQGRPVAESLGLALQLTNILRDLEDDADMGRLYLPVELLEKHEIYSTVPHLVLRHPALPLVCRELAERAEAEFASAREAMAQCDREAMRPARIMMTVYHHILKRLRRGDWQDVLAGRRPGPVTKFLRRLEKLLIALWQAIF